MPKKAVVVLADGFEETEAVTTIDLMRRAGIAVTVLGLNDTSVRGAHDIVVSADALLAEHRDPYDAIVLPGGQPGTTNLSNCEQLLGQLRAAAQQGVLCAAICAAPSVLAKAGVLQGRAATCYPSFEGQLGGAELRTESVVVDGNIITSRGVGTAVPFALAVIEHLCDRNAAESVAAKILYNA